MKFNSKIFSVALVPFYGYLLISGYVLVSSHFRLDVLNPFAFVLISCTTILAALCYSFRAKKYHMIALLLMIVLGGVGIYIGLILDPMNWMELIASAFVIAFGIAFYEMVEHHREVWHETD